MLLEDVCFYVKEKRDCEGITSENFVSTDNMLPNKAGITVSEYVPEDTTVNAFKKGDVLLSNIRPYFKKIWLADKDGGCCADVLILRPKGISSELLYAYLSQDAFFEYDTKGAKGSKMPRGDKDHIMKFPLKELKNGNKIGQIIKNIDDKIALNNKTNSELENMAKTVYDYWFTQFDFPDANGNPYKSSGGKMVYNQVLKREIPVGWEVGKLGNFLDKFGDGIHGTPEYDENGEYYFINGNSLGNKLISFGPGTLKVNNTEYQKIKRPITDNSILLSINGTLGSISFYNGEKIAIGKSACFLNVKNKKSKPFVYQILSSEKFQKYMYKVAGGSTIKNFAPKQAADYDIIIPPIELLEKFNEIASFYLIKQIKQEKENEELTKLRDYLLPLLMNGQITVN